MAVLKENCDNSTALDVSVSPCDLPSVSILMHLVVPGLSSLSGIDWRGCGKSSDTLLSKSVQRSINIATQKGLKEVLHLVEGAFLREFDRQDSSF